MYPALLAQGLGGVKLHFPCIVLPGWLAGFQSERKLEFCSKQFFFQTVSCVAHLEECKGEQLVEDYMSNTISLIFLGTRSHLTLGDNPSQLFGEATGSSLPTPHEKQMLVLFVFFL